MNNPEIIFEDSSILVINKPSGLNSDIDKWGNPSVEEWAKNYYAGKKQVRPVLMHRLDRLTSGILLISKKPSVTKQLQKSFEQNEVIKKYFAIVKGIDLPDCATLKHFLKKDFLEKKSIVVSSSCEGKEAILTYQVINQRNDYTLIEIELNTGRYHQIRAQLAAEGFPIIGDRLYGSHEKCYAEHAIYLHAYYLQLKKYRKYWEIDPPQMGLWNLFFKE